MTESDYRERLALARRTCKGPAYAKALYAINEQYRRDKEAKAAHDDKPDSQESSM